MAQYKDENEWFNDFIENYGIDAEGTRREAIEANQKAYNDGLTAVQRIYDRSSAGYGATAEMLRQNGLNNSGLAAFYQGIAEQNARQSRSDLYGTYTDTSKEIEKQYEANVKANKQGFALHKQGIQDKTSTYAMEQPYADIEELYAMALGLGADEITARQMAQNAYAYGEGNRQRVTEQDKAQTESIANEYLASYVRNNAMTIDDINNLTDAQIEEIAKGYNIDAATAKQMLINSATESDNEYAFVKDSIMRYISAEDYDGGLKAPADIVDWASERGRNITDAQATRMFTELMGGGNNQENTVKFTGNDGNEYSLSETIIDIYNTAIDNGMTDEEALEYVESNAGKLTEEEKAIFDVYRDTVKEETEEFTKTNSEIATNLVNAIISKDKTGIVNLIGEFKTIDNELYQTLSEMNKNGDTSGVVEAVFNWAKVNGDSNLVNNVGKEMLNLDYDLVFHNEADGKDIFDLLSAVANGKYGDGSMESTDEQLKYLLNKAGIEITSANVNILDVKNPRDGTETKSGSVKFTIKVQGKNTNVTIPVDVNKTRHFEGGKDGDVASDNGVDLYIKSGNTWYLLKGNTTTTGLSDDEWKVLRGSLAATNIRNVSTLTMKPLGERRRSFGVATTNGAPAEHFYDSFISSKEGDNQKKINNTANNAFNLEYKRNLK